MVASQPLNVSVRHPLRKAEAMSEIGPGSSSIVRDNEAAAARAIEEQNHLQAYFLVHTLVESLLRAFLQEDREVKFSSLIDGYKRFLAEQYYPAPTFVKELTEFNKRRNRIVHQLWRRGFSFTNKQAEPAARAAVTMYALLIEWLETFDPEIIKLGFEYDGGA